MADHRLDPHRASWIVDVLGDQKAAAADLGDERQQRRHANFLVPQKALLDLSIVARVQPYLSGSKCVIVVEDQSQAEYMLKVAECPYPLELRLKPGIPAEAAQQLHETFTGGRVVENAAEAYD
jgi:hypothetical protein